MTAAVLRSSPNLAVPQTQNTAPVHEFNCLYTHDLRRKQKRWQDGFLRYHTFNKRVMVYDIPRNFLGDLHWTSGDYLQEGDEMTLEKGGIMVQVADRIGETQTDLTDLLQRKDKTPARNPASSRPMMRHGTPHAVTPSIAPRTPHGISQLPMKHKSLNALLGQSRRPIGKASLPSESPYEARNRELANAEADSARESKRQKLEHTTRTPKTLQRQNATPIPKRAATAASPNKALDVIHISSDTEESCPGHATEHAIEAELLATSSPARLLESPVPNQIRAGSPHVVSKRPALANTSVAESPSVRAVGRAGKSASPAPAIVRPAKPKVMSKGVQVAEAQSLANREHIVERSGADMNETDSQKRGKSLKLVGGAPRKMLVLQSQKSRPASSTREAGGDIHHVTRTEANIAPQKGAAGMDDASQVLAPVSGKKAEENIFQRRIHERLANIAQKKKAGLQRSSSDVTEQRHSEKKSANGSGLRKTNSAVMERQESPALARDLSVLDFPFSEVTPPDVSDATVEDSVAQPLPRRHNVGAESVTKAFKPLTVKGGPPTAAQSAKAKPEGVKEDRGPWSREAFDLMDWRPPNMQAVNGHV